MALVDYSEAFSLCSDCLKLIGTLRQYNCVVAMEQQLLPLVESIEGELSEFFKSTYRRFDEASYRKVLKVYNRTGHLSRLTKSQPEYCELVIQEISLDTLRATGCGLNTNHKWDKMTYTQVSNALAASDAFASGFIRLCSELYVVMDCYNDVCHMHGVEPHNLQPRTLAQSIDTTGPVAMPTDAIATAPKVANPSTPPHHSAGDDNAIDETSAQPETINEEYIPSPTEQQHSTEGEDKELTDTSTDIRTQTTANHTATSDTDFERKQPRL
ncbi:hypothetical protein SARC_03669 [Sphaeroforma arctica JP610]|uniref:Vacuolar protein sorting-associated protein 54 N-terminal domain-containing protein n=1 Tax=Sphaeroforma arctica JP610 TaxID=667725 RepID=A0A0L0G5B8_9EUKA|nr:hypothetical protein SARC_03669 [Sphaeroforma arctica JP610]KNC84104.1 hypothetical protein SARC_03669 [Sphaeroforma arctica JP610]|eukprot:XP_014158006.1 hypothetical protein SARC_03669 [Sphaeroforma arctica JP610]